MEEQLKPEANMKTDAVASSSSESDADVLVRVQNFYTLPFWRYANLARLMVFMDCITAAVLWLIEVDNTLFLNEILKYHFLHSVFDLVVLSLVKVIALPSLYYWLEKTTIQEIDKPYDSRNSRRKKWAHALVILFCLICVAFTVTKGGLILNAILNDSLYVKMRLLYNIFVITATSFSLLEFLMATLSVVFMRRLETAQILHRFNEKGQAVDAKGEPIKAKATLGRVLRLAKPEAGLLCLATVALLGSSAAQMVAPLFFGLVVDAAQKSMDELNRTVVTLLLIYVGSSIASSIRSFLFTLSGQRLVARIRKDLFAGIIRQDIAFFDTNRTGELTNRLSSDTQVIQNAITVNMSMLARYCLQIIGSLALMFYLNAKLTGVLLAVVPIVSIAAVQYGMFVKKMRKKFQDRLADASTTAEESISSIRTVRSFAGEAKSRTQYGKNIDESYAVGRKLAIAMGSFDGTVGLVSCGAICMVLWYGGKLVNEKVLSPGILTSFLLYTLQVAMAFGLLASLYGDFMQAVGASSRIFELLDREPEISNEGGNQLQKITGSIDFEDVEFTYPSRPDTAVLKGVSFRMKPAKMVALVGPSGGGKSTIVNLIERFYDPSGGKILLGGVDLRSLDPQWFRTRIAMVSQEPTLFACSIKENISYGKESTMEEIIEVAKQANAHDFITGFEEGYDTLVGERGVRLSGGQKQRIAIARALIINPTILLLDEATSALDAESEHLVQEAIDRAMLGRTVLVIAHRLSTVRDADMVVVIDKGLIAEQGTHDELILKGGVYKKLVLRQLMAHSGGNGDAFSPDGDLSQSQEEEAALPGTEEANC